MNLIIWCIWYYIKKVSAPVLIPVLAVAVFFFFYTIVVGHIPLKCRRIMKKIWALEYQQLDFLNGWTHSQVSCRRAPAVVTTQQIIIGLTHPTITIINSQTHTTNVRLFHKPINHEGDRTAQNFSCSKL